MNKNIYLLLILTLIGSLLNAQVLYNEGKINVASGGYLVITGSYQNEISGGITLNGVITVSGNWTNNGSGNVIESPGTDGEVIFNGTNQTIGGTGTTGVFDFENLTISSGSTLVEAGQGVTTYGTATFTNPLLLKASSNISYRSKMATYINYGSVTGAGGITMELDYKTNGSSGGTGRGTYFTSPINGALSGILTPNGTTNRLLYVDVPTRTWAEITDNATELIFAKGYLYRSISDDIKLFQGSPNAELSYTIPNIPREVTSQFYLMGNPYPAVIDWNTFTRTNITNTIWYRTSDALGVMGYEYYNGGADEGTNNNGIAPVDGKIAPMQAFWVQCSSFGPSVTGTLTINNNSRSHVWGQSEFLKSSSSKTSTKDVLRLYLYTGSNRDESIFIQSESAQDIFDEWDSKKMLSKDVVRAEFFTISPEKVDLAIQSIKPITNEKIIRLGLSMGKAGEYRFVADLSKLSKNNNLLLIDKKLNVTHDLTANPEYIFSSEIAGFSSIPNDTSRFVIRILKTPTVITNNPTSVCSPQTIDLTSSSITLGSTSGLTFTYWTDAAATIPYTTPTNAEAGTYYIKGTASNGAYTISEPIEVIVNPTPIVVATNPSPVTYPATVDLTNPEITLGSTSSLTFTYWLDVSATIPYSSPSTAVAGDYYIKGIVDNTGCSAIAGPVTVTILTTGIPTDAANGIVIYSFEKQIHIDNCKPNSIITIYDIIGRQYYNGISKSDREVITGVNNAGIYIVKVVNSQNVTSKKVYLR